MAEQTTNLTTYADLIEVASLYLGSSVTNDAIKDIRRCIANAYRNVASLRNWVYYYKRGRLVTNAPYATGTVLYDHTGSVYERQLTLTGGTWPTWAYLGTVRIADVDYEVEARKSDTILTLMSASNPGADITTASTYELFRETYPLPVDWQSQDEFIFEDRLGTLEYVHPNDFLNYLTSHTSTAVPVRYTFTSDPNYYGVMAVSFEPAPDDAYTFDYIYRRRPRQLRVQEYKTGTASVGAAQQVVTGVGTAFKDNHIGCVIRFSENASHPTSSAGDNPYEIQRVIFAVASTTSLTLDDVVPQTFTNAKFTISDPVDIEDGAMMTLLLRELEKELRIARRMKPAPEEEMRYKEAVIRALEADSRSFARRPAEGRLMEWWKSSVSPQGEDIGV